MRSTLGSEAYCNHVAVSSKFIREDQGCPPALPKLILVLDKITRCLLMDFSAKSLEAPQQL